VSKGIASSFVNTVIFVIDVEAKIRNDLLKKYNN
jgi:hypothetical protein